MKAQEEAEKQAKASKKMQKVMCLCCVFFKRAEAAEMLIYMLLNPLREGMDAGSSTSVMVDQVRKDQP